MEKWDNFFQEKIKKIFKEKKEIIDIGGGLRILKNKGNRYDINREWILPYLKNVEYKILDPTADYSPDILGDLENLTFENNSKEAIICLAVLEHVKNPIRAVEEIYRVLKHGGFCLVYVPFLFYYHAEKGYYKDYWRFTEDSIDFLFGKFSTVEKQSVRGAFYTWIKLSPMGRYKWIGKAAGFIDSITGKINSRQVSGFYVFLIK